MSASLAAVASPRAKEPNRMTASCSTAPSASTSGRDGRRSRPDEHWDTASCSTCPEPSRSPRVSRPRAGARGERGEDRRRSDPRPPVPAEDGAPKWLFREPAAPRSTPTRCHPSRRSGERGRDCSWPGHHARRPPRPPRLRESPPSPMPSHGAGRRERRQADRGIVATGSSAPIPHALWGEAEDRRRGFADRRRPRSRPGCCVMRSTPQYWPAECWPAAGPGPM
jgi:hypothetical protein